jgi:hypothetical protein
MITSSGRDREKSKSSHLSAINRNSGPRISGFGVQFPGAALAGRRPRVLTTHPAQPPALAMRVRFPSPRSCGGDSADQDQAVSRPSDVSENC